MNIHTTSYREQLLKDLADPQEAKVYLMVALEEYETDTDSFMLALRNVAEAQGGIGALAKKNRAQSATFIQNALKQRQSALVDLREHYGFPNRLKAMVPKIG